MAKGNNPEQNPQPGTGEEENNQNEETNPQPGTGEEESDLDKFKKIKDNYENQLSDKDKEIEELRKQLKEKESEVDNTIDNLQDEVNEKVAQAEKMKKLQDTVNQLVQDKAEATVDKFIQQGKIAPAQRETALKLCLSDNDTFLEFYENAKPIVETQNKRVSAPAGVAERISNYLKK